MAELTNAEFEQARDNAATRQKLISDMLALEGNTINWMAQATVLHTNSHADDKADIIALRDDLIARLTSAVQLP